jgi:hypothetical protein
VPAPCQLVAIRIKGQRGRMTKRKKDDDGGSTATRGFQKKRRETADAPRNNMNAVEYACLVLGLNFLEYMSDAFASPTQTRTKVRISATPTIVQTAWLGGYILGKLTCELRVHFHSGGKASWQVKAAGEDTWLYWREYAWKWQQQDSRIRFGEKGVWMFSGNIGGNRIIGRYVDPVFGSKGKFFLGREGSI